MRPQNVNPVKMTKAIEKEHSYQTTMFKTWEDLDTFFDENDHVIIRQLIEAGIKIPEYLQTEIIKSEVGNDVLMSWPSKDTLICQQDTSDTVMEFFRLRNWHAYRIDDIDYDAIKKDLE